MAVAGLAVALGLFLAGWSATVDVRDEMLDCVLRVERYAA